MPQFNGKQGAVPFHGTANLRCPRNGKRRSACDSARSHSRHAATGSPATAAWEGDAGSPPARIPANEVACAKARAVTPNAWRGSRDGLQLLRLFS
jgi:hypothetical protein